VGPILAQRQCCRATLLGGSRHLFNPKRALGVFYSVGACGLWPRMKLRNIRFLWVVMVRETDVELRPCHYVCVDSIEGGLIMKVFSYAHYPQFRMLLSLTTQPEDLAWVLEVL
jgi:hypothetical protein